MRVSICHCLECKRRSGSAFSWNSRWQRNQVQIAGQSQSYTRTGDEGGRATFHFCPGCGVTVHYSTDDSSETLVISVGAFTDPQFQAPEVSVYHAADRRVPWLEIAADPLRIID